MEKRISDDTQKDGDSKRFVFVIFVGIAIVIIMGIFISFAKDKNQDVKVYGSHTTSPLQKPGK